MRKNNVKFGLMVRIFCRKHKICYFCVIKILKRKTFCTVYCKIGSPRHEEFLHRYESCSHPSRVWGTCRTPDGQGRGATSMQGFPIPTIRAVSRPYLLFVERCLYLVDWSAGL